MIKNLSPIQNDILSRLKNAKTLRYGELHKTDIPNDLFNYHLQHLVKLGMVEKDNGEYYLSAIGIKHVADPYIANNTITSLFKMNVITIVSRVVKGKIEILNQLRKSNPSYGKIGVMGGVVLKGESIEVAATRKLKDETGLNAKLKFVGCERRMMYKDGELFSDVLFPITYTKSYSGNLMIDSNFGHNMWVPINTAIKNESSEYDSIKSIVKVLKAIKNNKIDTLPVFFEESVQSDNPQ